MKKMIFSVAVVLVASFGFYIYSELEGLPWKHAEVKREAIEYMKQKYNMDAVAAGSFYNFKFKVYTAKVFNVMDPDKVIIHVEDERDFDDRIFTWEGDCRMITALYIGLSRFGMN